MAQQSVQPSANSETQAAPEAPPVVSEDGRLLAEVDRGSSVKDLTISPDSRHVAYVTWQGMKRLVIVDGQKQTQQLS